MDAVLLPVTILLAEMFVVTLSTLRTIFIARGQKVLAPCLGFFEIITWLFAISKVMQQLDNIWCFLAFAAGFTIGNLLGIVIEKALAMGLAQVSIVTSECLQELVAELRARDFGVTCVNGHGAEGPVQIVFTVVKRRQLKEVLGVVEATQPRAFYSVDDVKAVSEGIFPMTSRGPKMAPSLFRALLRKREAMLTTRRSPAAGPAR